MTTLTLERLNRDDPTQHGLCETNPRPFVNLGRWDRERIAYAISICQRCPILAACRNSAQAMNLTGGIVAGGEYHE